MNEEAQRQAAQDAQAAIVKKIQAQTFAARAAAPNLDKVRALLSPRKQSGYPGVERLSVTEAIVTKP